MRLGLLSEGWKIGYYIFAWYVIYIFIFSWQKMLIVSRSIKGILSLLIIGKQKVHRKKKMTKKNLIFIISSLGIRMDVYQAILII